MQEPKISTTSDHTIQLRLTPHTTIHVRVQNLANALVVYLTSTTHATSSSPLSSLGSFVYALPNRLNASEPLSTALASAPASIEFGTRAARVLARRTGRPVYVGNSVELGWGPLDGSGGSMGAPEVGEEIEALRKVVETVTAAIATPTITATTTTSTDPVRGEVGT